MCVDVTHIYTSNRKELLMKKLPVILITIFVLAGLGVGYYFWQNNQQGQNNGNNSNDPVEGSVTGSSEQTQEIEDVEQAEETPEEIAEEESEEESTDTTDGEKVKISIGVYPNLNEHIEAMLPQFNEKYPNIEVEMKVLSFADHHNALITALAAGSGAPDITALEVGFIAKFVADGGLVDFTEEPYNALDFKDQFAEYAWQQSTTTDGRVLAIPVDLGPGAMFWRRDVFDEVGVNIDDILESWDSYIEFGRQVTRDTNGDGKNDVFLIADAADVYQVMIRSGIEDGNSIYFGPDNEVLVSSERFHNALQVAKTIRDEGLDAEIGAWTNEWFQAFKNGAVATQFSGAWFQDLLRNNAPDTSGLWGVSNLPNEVYSTWGGSFYAIPEQSENKEAAWKLLTFLTTEEEVQLSAFNNIAAFPSIKSAWENPIFDEPIDFLGDQQANKLYIEIIGNIDGVTTHAAKAFAEETMKNAIADVLNDDRDIGEALADAQKRIERLIKLRFRDS